jgi:hypothetical protein
MLSPSKNTSSIHRSILRRYERGVCTQESIASMPATKPLYSDASKDSGILSVQSRRTFFLPSGEVQKKFRMAWSSSWRVSNQ